MVKIKTKKKITLPELIQWAWENDIKDRLFISSDSGVVEFNEFGGAFVNNIRQDETFTVEVEEEVTEEDKIHCLVEVYEYMQGVNCSGTMYNTSIQEEKTNISKAFYMLNDDYTMMLIWKDGRMVE